MTAGREFRIVSERLGPIGRHVPGPAALLNQAAVVTVSRHIGRAASVGRHLAGRKKRMGKKQLVTPKQPQLARSRDWYPYYAAFTEGFVDGVLTKYMATCSRILDPWSGSGTTSAVCARRGIGSVGIDINPALTVIAKARLTPLATRDSLRSIGHHIIEAARSASVQDVARSDLLRVWMRPRAVRQVRAVQESIHRILVADAPPHHPDQMSARVDSLPVLACFFYSALFATVRQLLERFRGTNPTWILEPKSTRHRISPPWESIARGFEERVAFLSERIRVPSHEWTTSLQKLVSGSATKLPFEDDSFDGVITSPPYATRIDYVRGVLPELSVLGADQKAIDALRKVSTGSPVVLRSNPQQGSITSEYARNILAQVYAHPSKGSAGYYWPWLHKYFESLQSGLREAARVTSADGRVCVVVQDSYYKELHVNLQTIVTEMMTSVGRKVLDRHDYLSRSLRSHMNPSARRHLRRRCNVESLLVFH